MGRPSVGAVVITLAVGATLALGLPGAALASSPGMVKASGQTAKQLVDDIGLTVPARCVAAKQARSDRAWGAYSIRSGSGCNPGDGYTVVHRSGGSWEALPLGGSYVPCSALKEGLTEAGAPASVFRDFKAGKFCVAGE